VLHHAQKVIAIFAAMRAFASALKEKGHRVRYVRLSDDSNRGALEDNLNALVAHYGAGRVIWQEPDEWRLDTQLQAWAKTVSVETACVSSEHFFTTREQVSAFFASRKSWRMEYFYREMRRQHGVLLTSEGEPEGGNGISMLKTASAGPASLPRRGTRVLPRSFRLMGGDPTLRRKDLRRTAGRQFSLAAQPF
jgi:deoxyribodipyrimidine photolyase-related protein